MLAVLLYFGLSYLNSFLTHESTDDAFIEAHVVSVAPRIAGQVLAVHVLDNQMVHSNDLLVEIDPADYSIKLRAKTIRGGIAERQLPDGARRCRIDARKKWPPPRPAPRNRRPTPTPAPPPPNARKADFERSQELLKQNTVSQQEFDAATGRESFSPGESVPPRKKPRRKHREWTRPRRN